MQRYWDLTDAAKRALTKEQLEALVNVELMENGVVIPPRPNDPQVEIKDNIKRVTVYEVKRDAYSTLATFSDEASARAFIALNHVRVESEYLSKDYKDRIEATKPMGVLAVSIATVCDGNSLNEHRAMYKEAIAKRAEYEERLAAFNKAVEKADVLRDEIMSDYREVKAKQYDYDRVLEVRKQYITMSGGDEAVAERFLRKSFASDMVDAALEYAGITSALPVVTAADVSVVA